MRISFLCVLFLLPFWGQAQDKKVLDSLNSVSQNAKHDTTKILALTSIAYEYRSSKPDSCISIAEKALQMSEKIGFEKGKGWALNRMARGELSKKNFNTASSLLEKAQLSFEKAKDLKGIAWNYFTWAYLYELQNNAATQLSYLQKALEIQEKIDDKQGRASSLNNIGVLYYAQGNYPSALEYHQKSLKVQEAMGNKQGISISLNNIGIVYKYQSNYPLALEYYQKSLKIYEEAGDKRGIALSSNNIGSIYKNQGNYPAALEYYQKSLKIREVIGSQQDISVNLNNIGLIYYTQYNYPLALEYYQKSLKIQETIGDKKGSGSSLNNIGNIYYAQGNYPSALEYYQKSLKIYEEAGDKKGIAPSLNNIGSVYKNQGNYPAALEYYQKSLKIYEEMGDKNGLTYPLNGLAQVAQKQQDYDKSIAYAQKSLQIAQEIKALGEVKGASETLFETYKLKGDYAKALEYHELYKKTNDSLFTTEKAKAISNLESKAEVERKEKEIEILNKNKEIDQKTRETLQKDLEIQRIEAERQKNAKLAVEKQAEADRLFGLARQEKDKRKQDSLLNLAEKNKLEAESLRAKERQLEAENKANQVATQKEKEAKEFQQILNGLIALLLVLALVFMLIVWRNRKTIKKAYDNLSIANQANLVQKEEIEVQAEELQTKNHALNYAYLDIQKKNEDITASITYALRIQNAIIPKETELQAHFPESFVFFRPKDIVSGDFYWFAEKEARDEGQEIRKKYILAAADCTGHGVSGAFMTMIGNNILNQIIHDYEIHEPDEILNLMPILLEKTLLHSEGKVADGMDISIVSIEQVVRGDTNNGNRNTISLRNGISKVSYAGAMNPLYYVQNQEFVEIKADKKPIGGKGNEEFSYQKHEIWIEVRESRDEEIDPSSLPSRPTTLYLCSDGFQDQFGGEQNKKFMVKKLKNLLFEISENPMHEQKQILAQTFDKWKGQGEQTDDVLVVGIRI